MSTQAPHRHRLEDEFTSEHHVYEPHKVGLPPIGSYVRELWRRREFAVELARTNLRAQHFNTVFGQLWLVINPLLLAGVYFVLVDILRSGARGEDFFAHLMAGLFAYYFVQQTLSQGVRSVVSGGRLILNTAFPRALLPISSVDHRVHALPADGAHLHPRPLCIGAAGGAGDAVADPDRADPRACSPPGMTMLVAAGQVYFRDLKSFLPYATRIWLYSTPILYYADEVPERYDWILAVNPLAPIISCVEHASSTPADAPRAGDDAARRARGRSASSSSPPSSSSPGSVSLPSGSDAATGDPGRGPLGHLPDVGRAQADDQETTVRASGGASASCHEIEAVKNVSFDVPRGSVLGVVGANGAGKSTLVRSIAGILPPTSGPRGGQRPREHAARARRRLQPQAHRPRERRARRPRRGLDRDELAEKYDEIVEFAELKKFMDLPMRTYSSGMYGRLAFSVAVNMDPDILLIDEALSVGDARFKRKSFRRMRKLCEADSTVVLV